MDLQRRRNPPRPPFLKGGKVDITALEAEIDRLVYALCGMADEEIAVVKKEDKAAIVRKKEILNG